jgi:hypothetical protein
LATILIALYAFCVLAPHAAMALTHGGNAAHCLTEAANAPHQHGINIAHVHEDGVLHEHGQTQSAKSQNNDNEPADAQTACCGLFFMNGLAVITNPFIIASTTSETLLPGAPDNLVAHGPGRLHRPPIV